MRDTGCLGCFTLVFPLILLLLAVRPVHGREGQRVVAYPVPDACNDSPYTISVNGIPVAVEKAGVTRGAHYARFQFTEQAHVRVDIKGDDLPPEMVLKPERFRTGIQTTPIPGGLRMEFDVQEAGPRFITKQNASLPWPLIIFAERADMRISVPAGPDVQNVRDYLRGSAVETEGIQEALDEASRRRGTVVFPAGRYIAGTLHIRDNTTVFLAPGALLEASTDPAHFPVDDGWEERSSHGPEESFSRFIYFDHCTNSKIVGHGVIEGRGDVLRNEHGRHVHAMDIIGCSNISVENVLLRNSAAWTFQILGSSNVRVDDVKVVADWAVGNTDGIDPDCSQNVLIKDFWGYCGDDAVAIKATKKLNYPGPSADIVVRDAIVMTRKTSFKIGTETYADVRNVLFENCEAVNSSRGIGLWMRDGSTMENVMFRGMRFDLYEIPGEGWSGETFRLTLEDRNGLGVIRNISMEDIQASAPYTSVFLGEPRSPLRDISLKNCQLEVRSREDKKTPKPLFLLRDCSNFNILDLDVHWDIQNPALWEDLVSLQSCQGVAMESVRQTGNIP